MEPDRVDELMRAERERWARVEAAKTPEELSRALWHTPQEPEQPEEPVVEPVAPPAAPKPRRTLTPTIVSVAIGTAILVGWSLWFQSFLANAS